MIEASSVIILEDKLGRAHASMVTRVRCFLLSLSCNMSVDQLQIEYERTSSVLDSSRYDTLGFRGTYPVRRHKAESEADRRAHEARRDWQKCIAQVEQFGNRNPDHGNFTSLVLPFTLPNCLRLAAYFHECTAISVVGRVRRISADERDAFLYDSVLESAKASSVGMS